MYCLKNYVEDVIDILMEDILKKYDDICKCEKCRLDIKAITLNNVKPRYGVSKKTGIYTKIDMMLDTQFKIDVTNQIVMAIDIVSKNRNDYGE